MSVSAQLCGEEEDEVPCFWVVEDTRGLREEYMKELTQDPVWVQALLGAILRHLV